jgi:hypothetical protein
MMGESFQETLPSIESISDWKFTQTGILYSWYISGQRACQKAKMNMNDCIIEQDIIL